MLDCLGQAKSLQLGLELRDIVPKHDNIVGFAADIPDVVAQQRLGLEAKALEQGNRRALIDRHLHRQFFQAGAQSEGKCLLR